MAGLVPAIHVLSEFNPDKKNVDARGMTENHRPSIAAFIQRAISFEASRSSAAR
jgi:hypothetical protein